jgi:hypothetical protein
VDRKGHKEIQRSFSGVMAGAVNDEVLMVICAVINFIYFSQLHSHTTQTLSSLQQSLEIFHKNKQVFV